MKEKTQKDNSIIGVSNHIHRLKGDIAKAAKSDDTVLILGPTGTGKELVAKAIYEQSGRKSKKFVSFNCGAQVESLLESELFGHVKGAFTGAMSDKKGLLEQADGGTIFLDEIGDASPTMQVKLLRVLQEGEIRPVGSDKDPIKINVRVIAATNKELDNIIKEDKPAFRRDLFYRLNKFRISTEPLAKRPEDIVVLVNHISNKKMMDSQVKALLYSYDFSIGNVRELENLMDKDYNYVKGELLHSQSDGDPEKYSYIDKYYEDYPQDFESIIEAYEILTLWYLTDLSQNEITPQLHLRSEKVKSSTEFNKRYGFPLPGRQIRMKSCPDPWKFSPKFLAHVHFLRAKNGQNPAPEA